MPPEVADCLKSLIGEEIFEKIKSGAAMPSREIGDQMKNLFEKWVPRLAWESQAIEIMSQPRQAGPWL